ncbi:non-specific lipid-transfer protein-like protein At5g64080 [Abrus precatorius]|uniref:Non-specific lipid-transfer protein-like protein At5g64080 n=1 Tax=Abrus precatorius TaxID=3816 RepID=A0A8B8MJD9_ABRPR|nr:non-specific lipid-transfer protein-like protein At5g64080 [Abrus precatorius]
MGQLSAFQMTVISTLVITSVNLVTGQISTPCTTSMINSVTPCINLITGSTNKGLTPSDTCCDSLLSLISTNMECACLLLSANVPFQLPINQVLALFLPQACNISEMPALCKASGSPLPAPGPALLGSNDPTLAPIAPPPLSPQVSKTIAIAEAPKSEILQPKLSPAPAELTMTKQKRPRKLQELDQYF